MTKLLANPWLHVAGVPLMLMCVGILAKRLGRRDGDESPQCNDWAVGTTILLMFLGAVVRDLQSSNQSDLTVRVFWLVVVVSAVFIAINHDRFRSWKRTPDNLPTNTKRLFVGIVLPDIVSLVIFSVYQAHLMGVL